MDFEEFCRKTDEIANMSRGATDPEIKKKLTDDFFDLAIDFFNEHLTGDIHLVDGRVLFSPAIENNTHNVPPPTVRENYNAHNETTQQHQPKERTMDETKQSPLTTITNFVRKHERKILITTTVVSTTAAVLMRTGIAQHNAFLKEKGLYEEFYALTEDTINL